ncbi:MAG: Asp-tRNA(Asn)/Glu-tRNA(Gln) amidotransferase subunit GatB, partial [Candidatus Helarchaeota archaeon]
INESKITPKHLCEMLEMIESEKISGKIGKSLIRKMIKTGETPYAIAKKENAFKINEGIEDLVNEVFSEHQDAVQDALQNEKAVRFLVGQVMKKTKGKADPELTHKNIIEKLKEMKGTI